MFGRKKNRESLIKEVKKKKDKINKLREEIIKMVDGKIKIKDGRLEKVKEEVSSLGSVQPIKKANPFVQPEQVEAMQEPQVPIVPPEQMLEEQMQQQAMQQQAMQQQAMQQATHERAMQQQATQQQATQQQATQEQVTIIISMINGVEIKYGLPILQVEGFTANLDNSINDQSVLKIGNETLNGRHIIKYIIE